MAAIHETSGGVTYPRGFVASGIHAGFKKNKKDLALIYSATPCAAAGVFTTNVVQAAPLLVTKEHLEAGTVKAVVVNSGQANACTGTRGLKVARRIAELTAAQLKISPPEVLVASTGVIGEVPDLDLTEKGLLLAREELSPRGGSSAAEAIMTTDTHPKEVGAEFTLNGVPVRLGAMAKGSGMIHPNMATLLGFVTTDAAISQGLLQKALRQAINDTLNMVSIDGDTSTNDMVLLLANGLAQNAAVTTEGPDYQEFLEALTYVLTKLARMIAADGEGATKLIEVRVQGAPGPEQARLIARSITTSNLVKTAVFGCDANWGRILCAAGYSGAQFNPSLAEVALISPAGKEVMAIEGAGLSFDEVKAREILEQKEIQILLDLHQGPGNAVAWTCDFSYEYVRINADYRT